MLWLLVQLDMADEYRGGLQAGLQYNTVPFQSAPTVHSTLCKACTSSDEPPVGVWLICDRAWKYQLSPLPPLLGCQKEGGGHLNVSFSFHTSCWKLVHYTKTLFCSQCAPKKTCKIDQSRCDHLVSRAWRDWFAKLPMSSQNFLSGSQFATLFVNTSSYLLNRFVLRCMASNLWSFAWLKTQAGLCAEISIVAESQFGEECVLSSISYPCGVPMFFYCYHCCVGDHFKGSMSLFFPPVQLLFDKVRYPLQTYLTNVRPKSFKPLQNRIQKSLPVRYRKLAVTQGCCFRKVLTFVHLHSKCLIGARA